MVPTRRRWQWAIAFWSLLATLAIAASIATAQSPDTENVKDNQAAAVASPSERAAEANAPVDLALPDYTNDLRGAVGRLPLELDRLRKANERLQNDSAGLAKLRQEIDGLQASIGSAIGKLTPLLPTVRSQLERLGPTPKPEDAAEDPKVTEERKKLDALRAEIDGSIKRLRLTEVRTEQLLGRLQQKRNALLAEDLIARAPSPLSKQVWSDLRSRIGAVLHQFETVVVSWFGLLAASPIMVSALLLVSVGVYMALIALRNRFVRHVLRSEAVEAGPLGFFKRTKIALWLSQAFAWPRLVLAGLLTGGVIGLGLHNSQVDEILIAILKAFLIYTAVSALARSVLTPDFADARLIGVDDDGARRISRLARALAFVYGLDMVLVATISSLFLPPAFGIVAGFFANVLFALLLTALIATSFVEDDSTSGGQLVSRVFEWLKLPVFAAALAVLISSLLGYLTLGRFIATQVMFIGIGGLTVFLIHRAIAATVSETGVMGLATPASDRAGGSAEAAVSDTPAPDRISQIVQFGLNVLLATAAVIAFLLSVGFSMDDVSELTTPFFSGFEVGGITISPVRIVSAIALFGGLIFATRLLQRWLSSSVLSPTRMDAGLAHSIHKFIGYAGMALAALAGLSYAGLDITNLAIVAGALSVGIGFGLQSIVNNFVSGLILLVERPIKVGDWIVVNGSEGHVRRISVRATEIETFDRATLILPNSELITGTVQNWTHRNSLGRVLVTVGVSYDSDPDHVTDVLLGIADECPSIIRHPAPFVSFDALADSALEFTLRAYVGDVNKSLTARTEIRRLIVLRFREQGIDIPFPQQDLHIKDIAETAQPYVVAAQ